jgi:hypothetical protein
MNTPKTEPEDYILVCVEKLTVESPPPATWLWLTVTNEIRDNPARFAGFEHLGENEWLWPAATHEKTALDFLRYCRSIGDGRMVARAYRIHGKPEPWEQQLWKTDSKPTP